MSQQQRQDRKSRPSSPTKKPKHLIQQPQNMMTHLPSQQDQLSEYQLQLNIISGQKTKRQRIPPIYPSCQESPISDHSQQSQPNLNTDLQQLRDQINLHKNAIQKANKLIEMLGQENDKLSLKIREIEKQLIDTKIYYEQKLQKSNMLIQELEQKCSRNQTAANSFIQYSKNSKITPIKIYGRIDDNTSLNLNFSLNDGQANILQQISKLMLVDNISRLQKQFNNLQEFYVQEEKQVLQRLQQNKYIQAYFQDQFRMADINSKNSIKSDDFGITSQNQQSKQLYKIEQKRSQFQQKLRQLIEVYERQLNNWQSYANKLKKQLNQCIVFIQNNIMYKKQQKKKKKMQYTTQDLVKFITKQIVRIFQKISKSNVMEIKQLREILKGLFDQIKKNQWKFVNMGEVKLP